MQACTATGRTRSDCGDRGRCSPVAGSCINKSALRGSSAPIQRLAAPHAHGPLAWQAGDATSRASRRPRGTQAVSMVGMSPQPRWRARNASAAAASAPLSAMSWDNLQKHGRQAAEVPNCPKKLKFRTATTGPRRDSPCAPRQQLDPELPGGPHRRPGACDCRRDRPALADTNAQPTRRGARAFQPASALLETAHVAWAAQADVASGDLLHPCHSL